MKLIITASTALIVLTPTRVVDNTFHTNRMTALDVAKFLEPKTDAETSYYDTVMIYYGALETRLRLRLGSSLNAAYQQVKVPEIDKPDYVLTQSVDAFYPMFHCKIPQVDVLTPLSDAGGFTVEMDVPPCPLADVSSGNRSLTSTKLNIHTMGNLTLGSTDYTHSDYYSFPCGDYHGYTHGYMTPGMRAQYGATSFFILSKVHWEEVTEPTPSGNNLTGTLERVTAVACNADFRIQKARITNTPRMNSSRSSYQVSAVEPDQDDFRHGLNYSIMEDVVYQQMSSAARMPVLQDHATNQFDYRGPSYYPESYSSKGERDMTGLFQLIAKAAGMNSVADCFNSTVLKNGVEASANGILAQWVHDAIFSNTTQTNEATLSYIEDRLRIRQLSLWFMFAGFLMMACLSVVLVS